MSVCRELLVIASELTVGIVQCMLSVLRCRELTWEGKDNVEAGGSNEGGKPALSTIQQHQHQPCTTTPHVILLLVSMHYYCLLACIITVYVSFHLRQQDHVVQSTMPPHVLQMLSMWHTA